METTTAEIAPETQVQASESEHIILQEVKECEVDGTYVGQTKWFNDKLGFGFITICQGEDKGKDIFVHHSGIKPLNSNYKTLRKGEYIQFNVINGQNGLQAVDVRGIGGGALMCDFVTTRRVTPQVTQPVVPKTAWQKVPKKNVAKYNKKVASE